MKPEANRPPTRSEWEWGDDPEPPPARIRGAILTGCVAGFLIIAAYAAFSR